MTARERFENSFPDPSNKDAVITTLISWVMEDCVYSFHDHSHGSEGLKEIKSDMMMLADILGVTAPDMSELEKDIEEAIESEKRRKEWEIREQNGEGLTDEEVAEAVREALSDSK